MRELEGGAEQREQGHDHEPAAREPGAPPEVAVGGEARLDDLGLALGRGLGAARPRSLGALLLGACPLGVRPEPPALAVAGVHRLLGGERRSGGRRVEAAVRAPAALAPVLPASWTLSRHCPRKVMIRLVLCAGSPGRWNTLDWMRSRLAGLVVLIVLLSGCGGSDEK